MAFAKISSKKPPNVIIIYSDDQGYADLNIYGSKDLITPNLDALARRGTRFTQFYAASPICSPSRASLLTGKYPQRAELVGNAPGMLGFKGGLPTAQYTMAEMFKDAGYKTAHVGKWHIGYAEEEMPLGQGFDYSFGFMGGCVDNYSHYYYWGGPNKHDLWENGEEIYREGEYFPDMMVDKASHFMEENKENPFFMYWAINLPHYPLQGKTDWLERYKDLPSPRDKYAAAVSTVDEKVGELLKKLDELGLRENTIIIFQADQGYSKETRAFGGGGSAGIYRGSKFSVFEGGVRVPAFISWEGHLPENKVKDQLVTNVDWLPTLAELCGIKSSPQQIDGKSMVALLNDKSDKNIHDTFYWQCLGTKEEPQWAVRDGDWKLMHKPIEAEKEELNKDGYFLVNLKENPEENKNVADANPDVVDRLHKKYQEWIKDVNATQ